MGGRQEGEEKAREGLEKAEGFGGWGQPKAAREGEPPTVLQLGTLALVYLLLYVIFRLLFLSLPLLFLEKWVLINAEFD